MGTINVSAPVSPLVRTAPSLSRVNAPPSIRGQIGMNLFGGSLSNSLAGDLEGLSQSINNLYKLMQTAQSVSVSISTLADLISTGGVAPNLLTLTIADGLLTISGTGTEAGHGDITIDGTLAAGELSLVAKAAEPTAPGAGRAFLYYDNVIGALRYNLGGAGWVTIGAGAGGGGYFTITPSGGDAVVDLANGSSQRLVLDSVAALNVPAPVFTGGVIAAGDFFDFYPQMDATGNRPLPTFAGGAGGFVTNTGAQIQMDPTPDTLTAIRFRYHGTRWAMDSQMTGMAIT